MKRKCKHILSSSDGKRAIYIDEENSKEILEYLKRDERHKDKFRYIAEIILGNLRMPSVYDKEDIDDSCKHVTAMKFFKGQENDRIYCKEVKTATGIHIVVAAILCEKKKTTKLTKTQKGIIQKVGGYDYEIK